MDYLGSDFNSTGSVIAKSELTAARLKRGECVTCGRKCFKKKFLKMIPIDDEEGKVVNGRCLNCNPLLLQKSKSCSSGSGSGSNNGSSHSCGHSSSHSSGKNRNRSKDRMSLGNIHNSYINSYSNSNSNSNVLLRRSKSHQPGSAAVIDAAIAVADCRPATPRDVESFFSHQGGNPSSSHPHQQDQGHRRGSTSGYIPPKRTLSSPARAETTPATNYHHHHQHQAAATASHTSRAARSIGCETFSSGSNFNSSFNVATTPSRRESLDGHSIASSSVASVGSNSSTHTNANTNTNNITTRRRGSYHPPLSREGSLNSCGSRHSYSNSNANSLSNSNHSTTSSSRVASREELEQAALTLMAAAQEHGLMDINSALADSLNNIVNLGGSGGAGGDLRIHGGSGQQVDGGPGEDPPQHPQPPEVVDSEGVLNRGGIFPMRYGRHIYTGSTRTLSSMSSIDEGDQQQLQQQFSLQHDSNNHNHNSNSNSNLQHQLQTLRMVGKSCRTLGSLSTIDGTEEDEINSLNGNSSGNLSHYSGTEASTIFTPAQAHNKGSSQEEKKDSDTNATTNSDVNVNVNVINDDVNININIINDDDVVVLVDRQLTQLRDSVQTSSSPTQSIRAIESLLDFIASFFDPSPKLDLLIEHGAVELLVSAMGKYSKSPIVQARACEAVAVFAAPCGGGGDDKGYESQSSSQSSAAASTERRRKVLDRKNGAGEAILFCSMILHEETADVQVAALNAIRCLCEDCEENQAEFLKLDLIEPIIRAMENHRNEPRLQEIGSSVISVLANNPNNEHVKSAIGLNGGLPVILRAILVHLDDIGVVETCCRALCELTADDPCNVVVFLDTPESTNAVLNAMRAHAQNPFAQEMGCAILANLTSDADHLGRFIANGKGPARAEAAPCVLGDGDGDDASASASTYASTEQILGLVIETILEAIQSFAHSPTVQTMGCAALSNLIDSNDTKMFVVDMGALDTLVLAMVLHKDNVRVLEPICHLLLLLAVRENHQHILAANPIELVRAAAEKFPDRCKEPANRLIQELGLN